LSICRRQRIINKERLSKKLEDEIVTFETKFKKLRDNIDSIKTKNNYENYEKLSLTVNEYNEELQKNIKES
jgi:iron uptake system EfeUOB component EfeO/EfeM